MRREASCGALRRGQLAPKGQLFSLASSFILFYVRCITEASANIFDSQDHVVLTSYPPVPEGKAPLEPEDSDASSDEDAGATNSSPPGAVSEEDEVVEEATVKPHSAEASLKRPRTPDVVVETDDEDEDDVTLASRAAAAKKIRVQDSGSSAPPKSPQFCSQRPCQRLLH